MTAHALPAAFAAPAGHLALGGGGLAHFLVRLFIWRMIWRFGMLIWRVPTFGPGILLLIVLAVAAFFIFRSRRGTGWPGSRGTGSSSDRGAPGPGPRDW